MPNPYLQQVHTDRPLTNMSLAYMQGEKAFVAGQSAPVVPVDNKSDTYFVFTKDEWYRDDAQLRAPGTESAGGGYDIDNTPGYVCKVYAYHKDIDEQITANADAPLNLERSATRFTGRKLLLRQEVQWATDIFAASKWTGSSTGGDITPGILWSDPSSTPIEDVQAQQLAMLTGTGFEPNTFVLGYAVYQRLVRHPDVIDLIKYGAGPGNPAIANEAALAKIFGVERVLVAKAVKNTAAAGATFAGALITGRNALLMYVAAAPAVEEPSATYTFMWRGISRGLGTTVASYKIPMPWLGLSNVRVESEIAFVHKIVGADLGVFFLNVVAAP